MVVVVRGKEHFAIWDLRRVLWKTRALLATLGGIVDIRIVLGQDAGAYCIARPPVSMVPTEHVLDYGLWKDNLPECG